MAKTFMQMVAAAQAAVPGITVAEAQRRIGINPDTLVIDVRDLAERRATGMVEGAIAISSGNLPIAADQEVPEDWRDARLQDRNRSIITVCELGPMSVIAASTLKDMGFQHVTYLEGGTEAWKDAGLPVVAPADE